MFLRNKHSKLTVNYLAEILSLLEIKMVQQSTDPCRNLLNLYVLLYAKQIKLIR